MKPSENCSAFFMFPVEEEFLEQKGSRGGSRERCALARFGWPERVAETHPQSVCDKRRSPWRFSATFPLEDGRREAPHWWSNR
jgi:hypothetical protein